MLTISHYWHGLLLHQRQNQLIYNVKELYSHNRAGVASLFAAFADQECSRSFTLKHLLSLCPTKFAHKPTRLILMWQILLITFQHVCAEIQKSCRYTCAAIRYCFNKLKY